MEYNPNQSRISSNTLAAFINKEISGNITEIPGIGPATQQILREVDVNIVSPIQSLTFRGIHDTYSLFAIFMFFKQQNTPVEHAQLFYQWLIDIGCPKGMVPTIVHAVGEKINISLPGIYNSDAYAGEEYIYFLNLEETILSNSKEIYSLRSREIYSEEPL